MARMRWRVADSDSGLVPLLDRLREIGHRGSLVSRRTEPTLFLDGWNAPLKARSRVVEIKPARARCPHCCRIKTTAEPGRLSPLYPPRVPPPNSPPHLPATNGREQNDTDCHGERHGLSHAVTGSTVTLRTIDSVTEVSPLLTRHAQLSSFSLG